VDDEQHRLTRRLAGLHEQYLWTVNAAVSSGATDQALRALADEYADAALRVLTAAAAPGRP